jgi:hypothetical protein
MAVAGSAGVGNATCPENVCDCFGAAASYALVGASRVNIRWGGPKNLYGYTYLIGNIIEGKVCTEKAGLNAWWGNGFVDVQDDVHALKSTGTAATLSTRDINVYGYLYDDPFVDVEGTVATGGGRVKWDETEATIFIGVDETGTHPGVATCTQALVDMRSASQTLAALAPTQSIGDVVLERGEVRTIQADPGVSVISAGRILVTGGSENAGSTFRIVLDPATDLVVVNASSFYVGAWSGFDVEGTGVPVIVNLPGPGKTVRAGEYTYIQSMILAPERRVRFGFYAESGSVFADKYYMGGGVVTDDLFGYCSP